MRIKKRLRYVREETSDGLVIHRAKRKDELALIAPRPGGGYDVALRSRKCKQRTTVGTISEAKDSVEAMRAAPKTNPLGIRMPASKSLWWAAGGAAAAVLFTVWLENRAQASTKPPATNGGAAPAPTPGSVPTTPTTNVSLTGAATQAVAWTGGPLTVSLPPGATGWVSVSVNGKTPATAGPSGVAFTPGPLQLPANPVGTYTFVYSNPLYSNPPTGTTTLTVTGATS